MTDGASGCSVTIAPQEAISCARASGAIHAWFCRCTLSEFLACAASHAKARWDSIRSPASNIRRGKPCWCWSGQTRIEGAEWTSDCWRSSLAFS
jgi:hypothetical protein